LYKYLGRVRIWESFIAPWVRTPKNVAFGYDVGNISTGYLVAEYFWLCFSTVTEIKLNILNLTTIRTQNFPALKCKS